MEQVVKLYVYDLTTVKERNFVYLPIFFQRR